MIAGFLSGGKWVTAVESLLVPTAVTAKTLLKEKKKKRLLAFPAVEAPLCWTRPSVRVPRDGGQSSLPGS